MRVTDRTKVLHLVKSILDGPKTTAMLMEEFGAGDRTVKRWIAEGRKLGADIAARRLETDEKGRLVPPYYWEIDNAGEIEPRLNLWLRVSQTPYLVNREVSPEATKGEAS